MKEKPILFSGPMVRAILEGQKTQTRRVVKNTLNGYFQPLNDGSWEWSPDGGFDQCVVKVTCPHGIPGDRLWVRESGWLDKDEERFFAYKATPGKAIDSTTKSYITTRPEIVNSETMRKCYKPVPSIHMPRWASRITLEIADVRVQRLQEISEEDAQAEGLAWPADLAFPELWDSINSKRGFGWDTNPWVWAISFKRLEPHALA